MSEMRTVMVAPERLGRWLAGFGERHGAPQYRWSPAEVQLTSPDGAEAVITVPFPPLPRTSADGGDPAPLLTHVEVSRTVGALLIRRGGTAVGVFQGRRLSESKVETSYVQGRTKAGGWSQQRYARRRDNQARHLVDTAVDLTVGLLLPRIDDLCGLVRGGDAALLDAVLSDQRLAPLREKVIGPVVPVPDPRLRVLAQLPEQFLAVPIRLNSLA